MTNFLMAHPIMTVYVAISFIFTVLFYIAPDFVEDHLVIQDKFDFGTFVGTMTHKNFGHFFGNLLILVPMWSYSDNVIGIKWTALLVLANMLSTGFVVLFTKGCCCGASGVNHMLLGLMSIMGCWALFILSAAMLISEFKIIGSNDQVAHGVHITWQIIGTVIGIVISAAIGVAAAL